MRIEFVKTRSGFLKPCLEAISHRPPREPGEILQIAFASSGGYRGRMRVVVTPDSLVDFETDWVGSVVTRFPARIKAAATALRDAHCFGNFEIAHTEGKLTITRLPD